MAMLCVGRVVKSSLPYPLYTSGHIATTGITGSFHVVVQVLGADSGNNHIWHLLFLSTRHSTLNVQPSVYKSRYDSQEVRISSKA